MTSLANTWDPFGAYRLNSAGREACGDDFPGQGESFSRGGGVVDLKGHVSHLRIDMTHHRFDSYFLARSYTFKEI